jgi:hypothetical protein
MAALFCVVSANAADKSDKGRVPLPWETLLKIHSDMTLPHEARPDGVPADFDWAQRPRLGAGNNPGSFLAVTGWGQVFKAEGSREHSMQVQIRDLQLLACHGAARKWVLLQHGDIEGNQFRADYLDNINKSPVHFRQRNGVASVTFDAGAAYHFWPKQGRSDLPARDICGFLVLLQAKAIPSDPAEKGGALIGLGADYWRNRGARWDNYKSNEDVAIGRLKRLTPDWQWFGLSTASVSDLQRLYRFGYDTGTTGGRPLR